MREVEPPDPSDRLRGTIASELIAQTAGARLPLTDGQLDTLADGLLSEIIYNWKIKWAPRYGNATSHVWFEDGEWFAECIGCDRITAHRSEDERDRWLADHLSQDDPGTSSSSA